jgi:hypothetical protein
MAAGICFPIAGSTDSCSPALGSAGSGNSGKEPPECRDPKPMNGCSPNGGLR